MRDSLHNTHYGTRAELAMRKLLADCHEGEQAAIFAHDGAHVKRSAPNPPTQPAIAATADRPERTAESARQSGDLALSVCPVGPHAGIVTDWAEWEK